MMQRMGIEALYRRPRTQSGVEDLFAKPRSGHCCHGECLDHIIVSGEGHLRRNLISYAAYYNSVRTHRSLDKDAPIFRSIQQIGIIRSHPILGGLHHHYVRV